MTDQVNETDPVENAVSEDDDYDAEWDLEEKDSSEPEADKVSEDAPSTNKVEEKVAELE